MSESFRRFGISNTSKDLLVIKVGTPPAITPESVQQHLDATVDATAVDFSDDILLQIVDLARVRKIYKLNNSGEAGKKCKVRSLDGASNGIEGPKNGDGEIKALEVAILGMIALRGA